MATASAPSVEFGIDAEVAQRLRMLRAERGWTLEELASRCGSSRATLSRIECGDVSPTTQNLARICAAFGMRMSELLHAAEAGFRPRLSLEQQPVWTDKASQFTRRSVSPPGTGLSGEVIECSLNVDSRIEYDTPPSPGQEHHLVMLEGCLTVSVCGQTHHLLPGDALRYRLYGPSTFETTNRQAARYMLFLV